MEINEAMRTCTLLLRTQYITEARPREALTVVLQELGKLHHRYGAERPCLIHKKNCCVYCETVLDSVAKPDFCPECGKMIDWSDPK